MNDEKLDNLFEEAFKVEYRKEFKEELKNMLLKEYDRRKKGRFYLRISTTVAACLVLLVILFLSFSFFDKGFNTSNTSFVKNEIEQALNLGQNQKTESQEPGSVSVQQKENEENKVVLKDDQVLKQEQEEKKIISENLKKSSSKMVEKNTGGQKQISQKQQEKISKSSNTRSKTSVNTKQTAKSITSTNQKKNVALKTKNEIEKNYNKNSSKSSESNKTTIMSLPSKIVPVSPKTGQKATIGYKGDSDLDKSVFISVYALKEERIDLPKEDVVKVLSSLVLGDVYKNFFADSTFDSVYVAVYQDYCYFKISGAEDFKVAANLEENVVEKVYEKTRNILDELGLENYRISVEEQDDIYRSNIIFYVQGYEVYDFRGYIDFDRFGQLKEGKIYLKKFLPVQKVEIYDIQTASVEFRRRYDLDNIDVSKIKVVYKKQQDIYIPHYIYIDENKIYWLEK